MYGFYREPLFFRYAGREMREIFSDDARVRNWRRLWLALAESQHELGWPVSEAQLDEMRKCQNNINYGFAIIKERECGDAPTAHRQAFAAQCPRARSVIGLGVDTGFVLDNSVGLILHAALDRVLCLLMNVIAALTDLAENEASSSCPDAAGHPSTLGRELLPALQTLLLDVERTQNQRDMLLLTGCRASELAALTNGDIDRAAALQTDFAQRLGFSACYGAGGSAILRKLDLCSLDLLGGIAQSVSLLASQLMLTHQAASLRVADNPAAADAENAAVAQPPSTAQQAANTSLSSNSSPAPAVNDTATRMVQTQGRWQRILLLARFVLAAHTDAAFSASGAGAEHFAEAVNGAVLLPQAFLATDGLLSLLIDTVENLEIDRRRLARSLAALHPTGAETAPLLLAAKRQTESFIYEKIDPLLAVNKRLLGVEIKHIWK